MPHSSPGHPQLALGHGNEPPRGASGCAKSARRPAGGCHGRLSPPPLPHTARQRPGDVPGQPRAAAAGWPRGSG
eukprot:13368960-Alexandrium_andersonii.AAC.1